MKPHEVVIQITLTYHFFMKFQVSSYFVVFVGKVMQCPKLASVDILLYLQVLWLPVIWSSTSRSFNVVAIEDHWLFISYELLKSLYSLRAEVCDFIKKDNMNFAKIFNNAYFIKYLRWLLLNLMVQTVNDKDELIWKSF